MVKVYDVDKHPLLCRYMKGLQNLKPTLPKYSFPWDVGIVLNYLSTLKNDSVFHLSGKLTTLLAVLCGQTAREILVVIDLIKVSTEEDLLIIRIG